MEHNKWHLKQCVKHFQYLWYNEEELDKGDTKGLDDITFDEQEPDNVNHG